MLAAFLVAALVGVALGGVWIGSAVIARHRAQAAADLAALAAAQALAGGPAGACQAAQALAARMGAVLAQCRLDQLDVIVTVRTESTARFGGSALASARAGPV